MPDANLARFLATQAYRQYCRIGSELYRGRQLQPAILQYRKAREAAQQCSYQEGLQDCRLMIGICLYQLGCFREALTELSPFLDLLVRDISPEVRYDALIHYIQSAQKIPVTLTTINRAYAEAELLLKATHNMAWRHELLVHRARLELARGNIEVALSAAQESMALKRAPNEGGYPGQVWDYHYDGLVDIALMAGDAEAAENYLEQWTTHEDHMPPNRHIRRARCLADLRCFQHRYAEAARWSEIAFEAALGTDYLEVCTAAFRSYIRLRLAVGDLDGAREALVRYARSSGGESKLERCSFYLALGNYYVTRAIEVGGNSPGHEHFTPAGKFGSRTSRGHHASFYAQSALRAYRKAQKIANEVDAKLECSLRVREAVDRINYCQSLLSQKIAQGIQ